MTQTPRDWQKDMQMCEVVTPGPWIVWEDDGDVKVQAVAEGPNIANFGRYGWGVMPEAKFTAEVRTALPYWLQEAKTLQDKLKELVEIIEYEADLADLRGAEIHARDLRNMVSTLYPDTTAPIDPNAVLERNGIDPTGWTWHTPAPKEGSS